MNQRSGNTDWVVAKCKSGYMLRPTGPIGEISTPSEWHAFTRFEQVVEFLCEEFDQRLPSWE